MPDKSEKEKRKQIMGGLRRKADEEFEKNLPMSRELFKNLFNHLDTKLVENGCDHTLKLTEQFLINNSIFNIASVKEWLADKGGYCDCEVLENVEEQFE